MRVGGNKAHESVISLSDSGGRKIYPATEVRILQVADMICEGKSKETCIKYIMESQEVGEVQALHYYMSAMNYLVPDDMDEYRKQMLAKNFKRLEKIIEKGMTDDHDLRLAKDAIAEMNKMLGIGGNKVTVAKNAEGDEMIQISFE